MIKFVSLRFLVLLFLALAVLAIRHFQPADLIEPADAYSDICAVSAEAAKVHENGYENAWIQSVNKDGTVQAQTVTTKLIVLFKAQLYDQACFNQGWIMPVTIKDCTKTSNGECNFKLPHTIYIGSRPVEVVAWKYPKPAS